MRCEPTHLKNHPNQAYWKKTNPMVYYQNVSQAFSPLLAESGLWTPRYAAALPSCLVLWPLLRPATVSRSHAQYIAH